MLKAVAQLDKRPRFAALTALGMALAAAVFVAFAPCAYRGQTAVHPTDGGPTETTTFCRSFFAVNGWRALSAVLLPVVLAGLGVVGARAGWRKAQWLGAVLLVAFCLLTGFSVGLFYMPAAAALVVAAATSQARTS
jgi:hypothetical protein